MTRVSACAIDSNLKKYLSKLFYICSGLIPLRNKIETFKIKNKPTKR